MWLVQLWSGTSRRTARKSRFICSHISELICSRTWRAFSRAAPMEAAMASRFDRSSVAPSACSAEVIDSGAGGGNRRLDNKRPQ